VVETVLDPVMVEVEEELAVFFKPLAIQLLLVLLLLLQSVAAVRAVLLEQQHRLVETIQYLAR
jgi:hypothetical protein